MKKHEACYWLNKIIEEERASIRYQREQMKKTTWEYGEKKGEPLSEDAIACNGRRCQERIDEAEKKLEALDMAAEGLTR